MFGMVVPAGMKYGYPSRTAARAAAEDVIEFKASFGSAVIQVVGGKQVVRLRADVRDAEHMSIS